MPEGTTGNLMDYGQGEELWKYQWDFIHDPEGGWFIFEDSEEGASVNHATYYLTINNRPHQFKHKGNINLVRDVVGTANVKFNFDNDTTMTVDQLSWVISSKSNILVKTKQGEVNIPLKEDSRIQVYKQRRLENNTSDSIMVFDFSIRLVKSPQVEFSLHRRYAGEFGFDEGSIIASGIKSQKFTTFNLVDGIEYFAPWITMIDAQTIDLQIKTVSGLKDDVLYLRYDSSFVSASLSANMQAISITRGIRNRNDLKTPQMQSVYRKDSYGVQDHLVGQISILSKPVKHIENVYIIYLEKTRNSAKRINNDALKNLLNSKSLNQFFVNVQNVSVIGADTLRHTLNTEHTFVDRKMATSVYESLLEVLRSNLPSQLNVTHAGFPKDIYVVITDISLYSQSNQMCQFSGGGVFGNNNLAIMYGLGHCSSSEDFLETIVHEIGHSLSLKDSFDDWQLGRPNKKQTKDNFMDYDIPDRKRFFRTQWENVLLYKWSRPASQ